MRLLFILCLLPLSFFVRAQTVTGSWYGIADPASKGANTNNYLTEFILKQKGDDVEGIFGYYFRSGYQSYFIRGTYNPKTRLLVIKNLPVTYFKSHDIDGIDCPMDFSATLFVSKVNATLTGSFTSHEKYKYTCPELKFSCTLDVTEKNQDSIIHSSAMAVKKYWKPRNEELVISAKDILAPKTLADRLKLELTRDSTAEMRMIVAKHPKDTVATAKDSVMVNTKEEERKKDLENLVTSFDKRKNILSTEVEIESDSVRLSFYDNGDIDGDSISVFINKVPVLVHQGLSEKALNLYLSMDSTHPTAEITMYAENLGLYPPNTALMVITDGEKRHEVYLSSSLSQNAAVRLRKKKLSTVPH